VEGNTSTPLKFSGQKFDMSTSFLKEKKANIEWQNSAASPVV
jgi:hypothetical protein